MEKHKRRTPFESAENSFDDTHEDTSKRMNEVEENLDEALFGESTF